MMSKPKSEDDLFGNFLRNYRLKIQAKNEIDNMMFEYSMMSYNSGKQPVQAHQINVFSNQMSHQLPLQLSHQVARIIQQLPRQQTLNLVITE